MYAHLCPPLVRLVANGLLVQLAVCVDVRTNVRNLVTVLEAGCDRVHGGLVMGAAVGDSTVGVVGGSLGCAVPGLGLCVSTAPIGRVYLRQSGSISYWRAAIERHTVLRHNRKPWE